MLYKQGVRGLTCCISHPHLAEARKLHLSPHESQGMEAPQAAHGRRQTQQLLP